MGRLRLQVSLFIALLKEKSGTAQAAPTPTAIKSQRPEMIYKMVDQGFEQEQGLMQTLTQREKEEMA